MPHPSIDPTKRLSGQLTMNDHPKIPTKFVPYEGDSSLLAPFVEMMAAIYDAQLDLALINRKENEAIESVRQRLLKVYDQLVKEIGQDPCERFATYTTNGRET